MPEALMLPMEIAGVVAVALMAESDGFAAEGTYIGTKAECGALVLVHSGVMPPTPLCRECLENREDCLIVTGASQTARMNSLRFGAGPAYDDDQTGPDSTVASFGMLVSPAPISLCETQRSP